MSNPHPRSRRQWEYLFLDRRNDGYDEVRPYVFELRASAPFELRDPYSAEEWIALDEGVRIPHAKRWVIGVVLDAMPPRPAPMHNRPTSGYPGVAAPTPTRSNNDFHLAAAHTRRAHRRSTQEREPWPSEA